MQFRHETAKDVHAPGFYIHLSPGELFFGAGLWHPDSPTTKAIRLSIASETGKWKLARYRVEARQLLMEGESLKRPPRGFDPDHEAIEDIKRKDFIATRPLTRQEVLDPDFPEIIASLCMDSAPLMEFLCRAVYLPF